MRWELSMKYTVISWENTLNAGLTSQPCGRCLTSVAIYPYINAANLCMAFLDLMINDTCLFYDLGTTPIIY